MTKNRIKILGALLALLFLFTNSISAYADNSSGLVIVPRENYVVKAGSSMTSGLLVTNLNNKLSLNLSLKSIDFTFADNTGTPKLLLNQNTPPTPWSLKSYLSFPQTVNIPPGQTAVVNVSINIPKGATPGSYYGGIEYLANNGESSSLNLSASGTTLLFVNVPGNVYENMSLVHTGAYQSDSSISGGKYISFATNPPSEIAYTLKNSGNVIETPAGSISLQQSYAGHNIEITNANPDSSIALIGQTRLFTACIKTVDTQLSLNKTTTPTKVCQKNPSLFPGKYNITLEVFYGQNGKQNYEVYGIGHFWYLPWWFIVIAVAVFFVVVYVVTRIYRQLNRAVKLEENDEPKTDEDEDSSAS
jgi:hypothetical protein